MKIKKTGQWTQAAAAMAQLAARTNLAREKAKLQEANYFRTKVLQAFQTRGKSNGTAWAPNAPSTIKKKRSSKPLIASAQLRNSVQVVQASGGDVFIGVPNFVMRADGVSMVSIAAVHEFGKVIVQARGGGFPTVIQIPQRSFIESTADKHFKPADVAKRYMNRIAYLLGPTWAATASDKPPTK